jgi:hypothetical protein
MKTCLLGIALILFAILLSLNSSGLGIFSLVIGFVGLVAAGFGVMKKD